MDGDPAKHLQADNFNFQIPSSTSRHDYIKPNQILFSTARPPETMAAGRF
jgi:hypothetical protein